MRGMSFRAALLLGVAASVSASGPAQTTQTPQGASDQRRIAQPGQQQPAAAPVDPALAVPPQSTAARPVVPMFAGPPDQAANHRAASYRPDGGGPLSGRDMDDDAGVADPAVVTTLAQAITLAYRTNPQLLVARAQARALDYRVPQARSAYGPTLSASAAYTFTRTRQEVIPGTFIGAQGWVSLAQAVLSQPLFTFGRNAAAEAGAVATSQYQRDMLRVTESQVLNGVVTAYVSVLRDAASVTIARQNLALLERQLGETQMRYEARDLTQTDLDQTRTRVELGRSQLLEAQGQLGISQKQFLQYVGAAPGELAPPDLLNIPFGSVSAAYAYAEANSGLIHAIQDREKISRAAVTAAKVESLPRVDVRGTADYGTVTPYTDRLRTTNLVGQVVLTQPIIDSGLRRTRLGEARENNQADWRLLDSAFRDTRNTIGSAWDQLSASRTSLASYRAAIVAAQRAYDGALLQQRAGDRSTLDVLDLARDLLTVRTNYNAAVASEYLARSALLAAAGLLEGPRIVTGLTGYDADEHYDEVRRKADIPLLTPALSALDGVVNGDNSRDRPSRDAGAQAALDAALPLPAPDPATAP